MTDFTFTKTVNNYKGSISSKIDLMEHTGNVSKHEQYTHFTLYLASNSIMNEPMKETIPHYKVGHMSKVRATALVL